MNLILHNKKYNFLIEMQFNIEMRVELPGVDAGPGTVPTWSDLCSSSVRNHCAHQTQASSLETILKRHDLSVYALLIFVSETKNCN